MRCVPASRKLTENSAFSGIAIEASALCKSGFAAFPLDSDKKVLILQLWQK
jgi:hypothetical protein